MFQWRLSSTHSELRVTRWRSRLGHCACSVPDEVFGIFHRPNPSSRTLALGSTQLLNINEFQGYFLRGKGGRSLWLITLPPSRTDYLGIQENQGPVHAWQALDLPFLTSTLDGRQWSRTGEIADCVLESVWRSGVESNFWHQLGIEPWFLDRPGRSRVSVLNELYRLQRSLLLLLI